MVSKRRSRKSNRHIEYPSIHFSCPKMMRSSRRNSTSTLPLAARDSCVRRWDNSFLFFFVLEKGSSKIVVTIQDGGRHMVDARPCFEEEERREKDEHQKADSNT